LPKNRKRNLERNLVGALAADGERTIIGNEDSGFGIQDSGDEEGKLVEDRPQQWDLNAVRIGDP
jgi:hypothetical protein